MAQRKRKLVSEIVGGEPYEYYSLGEYVVCAPGVSGGEPTFKYTRIGVNHAIDITDPTRPQHLDVFQSPYYSVAPGGKGFQGMVKRHRFSRGPETHGSHNVRKPGSVGASATPSRVFKGVKMAGRLGGKRVTQVGLTVHGVDAERNLLLVKGAVPGPKNGLVEVREERAHGRA